MRHFSRNFVNLSFRIFESEFWKNFSVFGNFSQFFTNFSQFFKKYPQFCRKSPKNRHFVGILAKICLTLPDFSRNMSKLPLLRLPKNLSKFQTFRKSQFFENFSQFCHFFSVFRKILLSFWKKFVKKSLNFGDNEVAKLPQIFGCNQEPINF